MGTATVQATNMQATAVNTISWLSTTDTTIVVPVYQRQYRWDIGGCEQLLADIRAVAAADPSQMHFIGSILSSGGDSDHATDELVLIDGQQRITTLMLLVAALHHAVRDSDPELAGELRRVLVHDGAPERTKLRPHRAWAGVFDAVVLGRPRGEPAASRFDDNYAFFRSQIGADEVPRVWRGLQKLEHVAITLAPHANAQQIFESLNSTGEPLRDHELIHNYVLMGLSHTEQTEIERDYWVPIEQNTGEAIGAFWRHFLVMSTGREAAASADRGVYDAFRRRFPRLDAERLRTLAPVWKEYSEVYRVLLEPAHAPNSDVARELAGINTFGRGMYPLVMRAYRDWSAGGAREALVRTLEQVQTLLLRRTIVGLPVDRLVARLCRARDEGHDSFVRALARITPSDERMRVALRYSALPHAAYVLGRLADADDTADLGVEHIVPLAPGEDWSGDGRRRWADFSEDEQNSHRALAPTLGNLTLLEDALAERAVGDSFPQKRRLYARSALAMTAELAGVEAWGTATIAARTARLTDAFVRLWRRPDAGLIDDDGLTPVLDAQRRRGWPHGWDREFEYVEYRGEHWEVHDVKHLFHRIFTRLWADLRPAVLSYAAGHGGPIYDDQAWAGQWEALDEAHFLYLGWDSSYMLTAVQGVLEEAGIAAEVFVKYSYVADYMTS